MFHAVPYPPGLNRADRQEEHVLPRDAMRLFDDTALLVLPSHDGI